LGLSLKLQQGQVWKCGDVYVRIVHLARLEVGYKSASNRQFSDGKHHHTSKKDFCRLLKGATLIASAADKTLTAASADGPNVPAVPAASARRNRPDAAADPNAADDSVRAENRAVHPPD
jgi:hypothetical protein